MAPPNGPVESAANKIPAPETRVEGQIPVAPDTAQKAEVPAPEQEKKEVKLATAAGEEGLHQQTAASQLEQYQPPSKSGTPEEEDLGTNKGAMDKISDGMQKAFELIQRFMKQIQSMGSSTLRGMASTLAMLGFKKAAEWLNEMAGADYAELMTAMKKNNLKLAPISPEDPEAKAKGEAAERGQAQLADRFKALAPTRGPSFTREMYYSEVVTAWKKKGGNGGKTDITHNDLLDMAVTAQELPATLPGQVAQPQQMFATTLENLPLNTSLLSNQPTNITVNNGQVLGVRMSQDGTVIITKGTETFRYRVLPSAVPAGNSAKFSLTRAQWTAQGLTMDYSAEYKKSDGSASNESTNGKTLSIQDVKNFLDAAQRKDSSHIAADLRFEMVPLA